MKVYLYGVDCGDLNPELSFTASAEWLLTSARLRLSCSLAADPRPTAATPFFLGLLPEGRGREVAEFRFRDEVTPNDDYTLLGAIGLDCAGAVQIDGGEPISRRESPRVAPVGDRTVLDRIRDSAGKFDAGPKRRVTIAGVQPKDVVFIAPGDDPGTAQLHDAFNGAPSTHIIKPAISRDFRSVAWNEKFCLDLGRALGLPTVEAHVRVIDGVECFITPRYDRLIQDGQVKRIHQEDFTQALGRLEKYERPSSEGETGVSIADCFALVREHSTRPSRDISVLLKGFLFNFLICNADAHGKNFSLIHYPDGQRRLAPFYDLICTASYRELSPEMSMSIGGCFEPDILTRDNFGAFAEDCDLTMSAVEGILSEMCGQIYEVGLATRRGLSRDAFGPSTTVLMRLARRINQVCEVFGWTSPVEDPGDFSDVPTGWSL